jgi:VIT1/CCC1 family predicted Fe2+/Mn2+ transporter
MKHFIRKGFSFGLTSGIITTLGLIVGLDSSTHDAMVVIGGILIIAITDAMSDALGMHMSEESSGKHTKKEVWAATLTTFLAKFLFALTFVIPVLLFELTTAVIISIVWGLTAIILLSLYLAKRTNEKPHVVVLEHIIIALAVIVITHYVGDWIRTIS